ncbi:hypothetical protein ACFE04_024298 [Oxalis oulophora]
MSESINELSNSGAEEDSLVITGLGKEASLVNEGSAGGFEGLDSNDDRVVSDEKKKNVINADSGNHEVRKMEVSDPKVSIFVDFTDVVTYTGKGKKKELEENNQTSFVVGDIVWIKTQNKAWWPGKICEPSGFPEYATIPYQNDRLLVQHFGTNHVTWCFSPQLKPFVKNFEPMSRLSQRKIFIDSVGLAIDEFSNRQNSEMARHHSTSTGKITMPGKLSELSITDFEPASFLAQLKSLALSNVNPGVLQFVTAQNRLSAFYNFIGHSQIPPHQLQHRSDEEDSDKSKAQYVGSKIGDQNLGQGEENNKGDMGFDLRVRKRSKYLSYPYSNWGKKGPPIEDDKDQVPDETHDSNGGDQIIESPPVVKSSRKKKKRTGKSNPSANSMLATNSDTSNLLSQLYRIATDCCHPNNKKEFGSVERFFSQFRISAFLIVSLSEINKTIRKEGRGEVKETKMKKQHRKSTIKVSRGELAPAGLVSTPAVSNRNPNVASKIKGLKVDVSASGGDIQPNSNGNPNVIAEMTNNSLNVELGKSLQNKNKRRKNTVGPKVKSLSGLSSLKTDVAAANSVTTPQVGDFSPDCKLTAIPVIFETEQINAVVPDLNGNARHSNVNSDLRENGSLLVDVQVNGPYSNNFVTGQGQPNSNAIFDIPSVQPGEAGKNKRKWNPKATTSVPDSTGQNSINFVSDQVQLNPNIPTAQPSGEVVRKKWQRKPKVAAGIPDLTNQNTINFASDLSQLNSNSNMPTVQPSNEVVQRKWRRPKDTPDSTGQISINFVANQAQPYSNASILVVQPSGEVVRRKWERKPKVSESTDSTGQNSINLVPNLAQPYTNSTIPVFQPSGEPVRRKWQRRWQRKPKVTEGIPDLTGQNSINFVSDQAQPYSHSTIPIIQPSGEPVRKKWQRRWERKPKVMEGIPDLNGTAKPEPKKRIRKSTVSAGNGELLMTFSPGVSLPTKEVLVATFSTFGPLMESEIKILEDSGSVHVVFTSHAHAEEAFRSLAANNPFCSNVINYQLRRISTPNPVQVFNKIPARPKVSAPSTHIPANLNASTPLIQTPANLKAFAPLIQTPANPMVSTPSAQTPANLKGFGPLIQTPANPMVSTPSAQTSANLKGFGPLIQTPANPMVSTPLIQTPANPNPSVPLSQPVQTPPIDYIKQNLEMMTSMLEKSGNNLSPGMRVKLENEIKGLMEKVRSMP